jgi:hypothetical protein
MFRNASADPKNSIADSQTSQVGSAFAGPTRNPDHQAAILIRPN